MASASRWICLYCEKEGRNIQHLDETFKKEKTAKDGENGEEWIGCMTCEVSFHVRCFLMTLTQDKWEEGIKKINKEVNKCLRSTPVKEENTL